MHTVTEQQIQQVLDYANKVIQDDWKASGYTHEAPPTVTAEKGRRYVRLIRTNDAGKGASACYGFLDLTNGDLLKPASWKAPERNFARGNVHANKLDCCGWCRIS